MIVVDTDRFELHFIGERIRKTYRIGLGRRECPTPHGTFRILSKVSNPQRAEGDRYDEENIGSRYMEFLRSGNSWKRRPSGSYRRLGIHGTRTPKRIGTRYTLGCVAMYNRDLERLFQYVQIGQIVKIVKRREVSYK